MKKTLIALAVAASAAVSGSAMAWEANGIGGPISIGGTLTPADNVTPWEVKVGATVTNLDAPIKRGQNKVEIPVKTAIPVLGIRTVEAKTFTGKEGITPQIDYGPAVNIDGFADSRVPLTLDVKDANDRKIGSLVTRLVAGAQVSMGGITVGLISSLFAGNNQAPFWGGLPKTENATSHDGGKFAKAVFPEVAVNFVSQPNDSGRKTTSMFNNTNILYSAFYGSGIEAGQEIAITLDSPVQGNDSIAWKATLPVTVSYR